jgi:putative membrane protein
MKSLVRLTTLLAVVAAAGAALAADAPPTAEVLGKLHRSNLKEIEMGKMAQTHGKSKDVKSYGKTLVEDHGAADKKVFKLAKEEKIDLGASTPPAAPEEKMPMDAGFDAAFSKSMLEDHKKDIDEVKTARAATQDAKLKKLLDELLPVLEKHRDIAQKLVDGSKERAAL